MVKIVEHPIIKHKLTIIRKRKTPHYIFRTLLNEISTLMAYEVFRDLQTETIEIVTPVSKGTGYRIKDSIVILPILRAGISMVDGMQLAYPLARVGHIGLARDEETFKANSYYYKMPLHAKQARIFVVDPMLATGGSSFDTIAKLKAEGYQKVTFVCILAVQEGIDNIARAFPDVDIFTTCIDPVLTSKKYISPGLGDAGDRYFGTTE